MFVPIPSYSQDIGFEASVNTSRAALGSSLQLSLTITGTQDAKSIDLPSIDGLEHRYLGPSTRISIVNGKYSSSIAHIYTLIPLKVGKFQIPSISISISGKTFSTNPINFEVVDQGGSQGPKQNGKESQALNLKDKVFLTIEIPKTTVYLNEKNSLTIKLYISGVSLRDIQFPEFKQIGFNVDEFQKPTEYQEIVGGIRYQVAEFKTFIYPTRVGKFSIGPVKQKSNILIRSTESRRRFGSGGLDSFFNDDFFGRPFERYQKHPITIESNELSMEVLPLPEQGMPNNFSGAVGQFEFEATVSPREVKVGDPVTLRMNVQGEGSLKTVAIPSLKKSDNFKLYEPQIKVEGDKKTLEQVVIPLSEKATQIPAIEFSYFDGEEKKYNTITKGPFLLEVTKLDTKDPFKLLEFGDEKKMEREEKVGRDIIFIKDHPGKFRKKNYLLYKSHGFVALVVATSIIWMSSLLAYRRTVKLKTDIGYARRLQAPKQARKSLSQALKYLEKKQQKDFYNSIFKTLQEYFGNKYHLASGAVTVETVKNNLNSQKTNAKLLENIESVFAECDLIRYASVSPDEGKMREDYKKTEEIIDYVERHG